MPKAAATPLLVISRPCPQMPGTRTLPGQLSRRRPTGPRPSGGPWPTDRWTPRSRAAAALSMSRREMLGKGQVAAPLMAQVDPETGTGGSETVPETTLAPLKT